MILVGQFSSLETMKFGPRSRRLEDVSLQLIFLTNRVSGCVLIGYLPLQSRFTEIDNVNFEFFCSSCAIRGKQ